MRKPLPLLILTLFLGGCAPRPESIETSRHMIGRIVEYVGERNEKGEYHGKGTATYTTGKRYLGEFINGKPNGKGTLFLGFPFSDYAERYVGEFKDGYFHGQGTYFYGDNYQEEDSSKMTVGMWKDGEMHGLIKQVFYTVNYFGEYDMGKRRGYGVDFRGDEIESGIWAIIPSDDYGNTQLGLKESLPIEEVSNYLKNKYPHFTGFDVDTLISAVPSGIKPLNSRSIIPSKATASVNKSVNIATVQRIAIVGINYHRIPSIEDDMADYEMEIASLRLKQKLKREKFLADLSEEERKRLEGMDEAAEEYSKGLDNIMKRRFGSKQTEEIEFSESITYTAYEEYFLKLGFDLLERDKIEAVLNELALSMTGLVNEESAAEVGNLLGAEGVCLIEVKTIDGKAMIPPDPSASLRSESFKVIKVETGQIAFSGMHQNAIGGMGAMFTKLAEEALRTLNKKQN